ncbi:hypothetical protein KDC96_08975 [Erythrobacter sp. JK5]|nr:hypothetical protein KDC96_08975 [Erythrobacter sp. JK5]
MKAAFLLAACSTLAVPTSPGMSQRASGAPVARYTIDAGTLSGFAAMSSEGGMASALAMMRGESPGPAHEMILRLGSNRDASGDPKADHFMPTGAALGTSVPLVTPRRAQSEGTYDFERPKGRLRIYWGCGERAGPGQPVVIDFSKMAAGQYPPDLFAPAVNIPEEWRISPSNSRTYGDWPNEKARKHLSAQSSLLGRHRIVGNYSPEIGFELDRDFMAPLQVRNTAMPSGAYVLDWTGIPDATGYYAWVMSGQAGGGGESLDMVWWASSATRAFGGPMWDWMSPAAVATLVSAKTVMPPSQTSCTVPAEVAAAGGEAMMGNLSAFGPQRDFAFPPRPADPKIAWNPEWIARVRFRSTSMFMLGMDDMAGMMAGTDDRNPDGGNPAEPVRKPKCKGLAGIAKRAAGLCE